MLPSEPDKKRNVTLWQYAGMGTQFLAGIGIGVFAGVKADEWLNLQIPLFVWLLPLVIMTGVIVKLVKGTSKRK